MSSSQPLTKSTSPTNAYRVVRCNHGEAAVKKISQTPINPNREFYICSRVIQSERCKFFYWADDPTFTRLNVPATPPAPPLPITIPSQKQRADTARALGTPQKSPNKRLADIQAALDTQELQPRHSTTRHNNSRPNAALTSASSHSFLFGHDSQSSQSSTTVDLEEMSPRERSSSSISPHHADLGSLRTPKKPRLSPLKQFSSVVAPKDLPFTPPQTTHRRSGNSSGQGTYKSDVPSTPTRHKGKERAYPRWDRLLKDDTTTTTPAVNTFGAGSDAVTHAFPDPFLDSDVVKTTAERISSHLESLNTLHAVSYIRKLERKFNALDLSNKTKKNYISELKAAKADLENEKARLMQENADLQKRLHRSEQSSRVKDVEIAAMKARRPL